MQVYTLLERLIGAHEMCLMLTLLSCTTFVQHQAHACDSFALPKVLQQCSKSRSCESFNGVAQGSPDLPVP